MLAYYNDPGVRTLLNREAIFEIKSGMKLSAFDLASASVVRSQWYQALCRLFERCDYLVVPTAQGDPVRYDGGSLNAEIRTIRGTIASLLMRTT